MTEILVPAGTPKDEFIDLYGEEELLQVPSSHIISWNKNIFILDGWENKDD